MELDLLHCFILHRGCEVRGSITKHLLSELSKRLQFVGSNVLTLALGKSVNEEREFSFAKQNYGPKSSGFALACPRDALFEDAAAKVGIYLACIHPRDCIE